MRTVVLDPGHGGPAAGVIGARGRAEKELTLALAQRVATRLSAHGRLVALTRADDRPVPLAERAAIARRVGAGTLVSLHFDGDADPRTQGTSAWAHAAAGPASARLAGYLGDAIGAYAGLPIAPVGRAPLALLDPRALPPAAAAAHLEVSHLSDPREEARLGDPAYLDGLADAIVHAIERHQAEPSAPVAIEERRTTIDLWHEVPLVPQVTGMSCWAAGAAMLIGWRDSVCVDPEEVARAAGRWQEYRDGLEPKDVESFARTWGLVVERNPRLDAARLRALLESSGPLWIGEASPGLHVVVVAGLVGDGTDAGTELRIVDPWPVGRGERYRLRSDALIASHRAAAIGGTEPLILHTGGRGRGARRATAIESYRAVRLGAGEARLGAGDEPLLATQGGLRRYRAGIGALDAAARAPVDAETTGARIAIAQAADWLRDVAAAVRDLGDGADPMRLQFESIGAPDSFTAEYGGAIARVRGCGDLVVEALRPLATRIRDQTVAALNASSVTIADAVDPALPPLADVIRWREAAVSLATRRTLWPGLDDALAAALDAALALHQARGVLNARATWRSGAAITLSPAAVVVPTRPRDEVDDIFSDSGFNTRAGIDTSKGHVFDWCGMFAVASLIRGGGLQRLLGGAGFHTNDVVACFTHTDAHRNDRRTPHAIKVDGVWTELAEYHLGRELSRRWTRAPGVGADLRPGDLAVIDHTANGSNDHIVLVEAYDAATGRLVTIEGNTAGGIQTDGAAAQRLADGTLLHFSNPAPETRTNVHIRDLSDAVTLSPGPGPGGAYRPRGRRTVVGVGRWSLVDFETHEYAETTAGTPTITRAARITTGPYWTRVPDETL